jgi:hypothetical protein
MEISQATIAKEEPEVKLNLADDVMRLLNVRDRNSEMSKDWLIFISTSNFKITAGEIYLAFKMALSREILDDKGKEIDLFPELSNNTTGKVISAYLRCKKESNAYQLSKDKLKALKTPEIGLFEEGVKKIRENFLTMVFNELTNTGFCSEAYCLFDALESSGKIIKNKQVREEMYAKQMKIYGMEERAYIRGKYKSEFTQNYLNQLKEKMTSSTPVRSVANRCKSILASQYLIGFIQDFETFKTACHEPSNI